MGYFNYFSYVFGVNLCIWGTLTISVMLLWLACVHGYINYYSYVTGVGMFSWVTLTISVMLLGKACVL